MEHREIAAAPTGTVTFLFTDIEGSTRRAEELGSERWADLLGAHHRLLRRAFSRHGHEVRTQGDALFVAFERATDAATAAIEGQRALRSHDWPDGRPIRVRIGMHTGEAILRGGDYIGHDVHRASRICDAGHGGQILLSEATAGLVRDHLSDDASLVDLGPHRLKDLGGPQRLFAIEAPELPEGFPPLRTLESTPNNLPLHRSGFVGREGEIARVRKLLEAHPLVTLTGVGGAGKTRLALQVGAEELDRHPQGVFFVDLAPISDPDLVVRTTADSIGLQLGSGRPPAELLADALVRRPCLLVLDNCEHLLDACADVVDGILQRCPGVVILATSREPLEVEAEQVFRVPSLSLPEEVADGSPSEAVDLFMERARTADPDFARTGDDLRAVAQICRRLDGIPLAIEFAAARVAHLTPQAIAERLDDRFRLLTGGRRRVRRQQTLEAALDWSHDLLDDAQQTLLRRLGVFVGSFDLQRAEEVCSSEGIERAQVLDLLASLVDKSLVVTDATNGEPRYRLLETVRSYAEAKLRDAAEAQSFRSRHRDAYLAWLEAFPWDELANARDLAVALLRERSNLRAALEWSKAEGRRDLVGRLAARMMVYWTNDHEDEGYRWLTWALEAPDGLDRTQQAACYAALTPIMNNIRTLEVEEHANRATELGHEILPGLVTVAFALRGLGAATRWVVTGDPGAARRARALVDEGVEAARKAGGRWPEGAHVCRGGTLLVLGDVEGAERSFAEAAEDAAAHDVPSIWTGAWGYAAACRTLLGDPAGGLEAARLAIRAQPTPTHTMLGTNWPIHQLPAAFAAAALDLWSDAGGYLEEGLRLGDRRGDVSGMASCLIYAGAIAHSTGNPRRASRLLAAGVGTGTATGRDVPFPDFVLFAIHRHYLPLVREALDRDEARRCRDAGRAMTVDEAFTEARELAETLRERGDEPH